MDRLVHLRKDLPGLSRAKDDVALLENAVPRSLSSMANKMTKEQVVAARQARFAVRSEENEVTRQVKKKPPKKVTSRKGKQLRARVSKEKKSAS